MIRALLFLAMLNWQSRSELPVGVAGGYSAMLQGKLVHAGGTTWQNGVKRFLRETYIYDPASDKWTEGPKLPEPLAYGAFVSGPQGLEILGGTDGERSSHHCYLLPSPTENWKKCEGDAGDTLLTTAHRVGSEVMVAGGCPNLTEFARCGWDVRARDALSRWTVISRMPVGSVALTASASLNGAIYLFGGVSATADGGLRNHTDAYRFDVKQRRWTTLRPLPRAARAMTAVAWDSRYILLAGGYIASQAEAAGKPADFGFSSDVHLYDTATDQYRAAGSLPVACASLSLLRFADGLFAFGGEHKMRARSTQLLWSGRQVSP